MKRHAIALNFQLPDASATLPDWLLLVPAGQFTGRDGRSWINSQPDKAVAYNRSLARDVVVDIEHASEIKAPKGEPAPAAGWIDQLEVRDGAIWGHVAWNSAGTALLQGREYRYYSPAIIHDGGGRVLGLKSVGLTNQHNLVELPALNHQQTMEDDMSLTPAIRKSLGLPDTATDADAVVAIEALKSEKAVALNAQLTPAPDKFVPRADYDLVVNQREALQTSLNAQRQAAQEAEITVLVDKAVEDKKIAPASRDYHVATCRQEGGIERFKQFLSVTPALVPDSGLDDKDPGGKQVALNSEQQKIAAMFGNTAEDIAKYNQ